MAKQNDVQVVEKYAGAKIEWRQSGTKLIFGDDDLTINCSTRQRDWPVHADVCMDDDRNLVIGVGVGKYYVAQIDIPETAYIEVPDPDSEEEDAVKREAQPIDMGEVVLTLWSVDDFTIAKED